MSLVSSGLNFGLTGIKYSLLSGFKLHMGFLLGGFLHRTNCKFKTIESGRVRDFDRSMEKAIYWAFG